MAKTWIQDLWVTDAEVTMPDGTKAYIAPTSNDLKNIKKLPEHFRTKRFGRGKRWRLNWLETDGTRRTASYGTKAAAEAAAAALEDDLRSGRYVNPHAASTLFEKIAGEWLETRRTIKGSTFVRYEDELSRYVLPKWGKIPLSRITVQALDRWVSELLDGTAPRNVERASSRLSPATIRSIVKITCGGVLEYAVKHKYLPVNPVQQVTIPKAHESEVGQMMVLSLREVEEFADKCAEYGGPTCGVLVRFLAYCGTRVGEACALKCGDVDLEARRVHIRRTWTIGRDRRRVTGTPKTGKARAVPVPGFLVEELRALCMLQGEDAWLFRVSNGAAVDVHNFRARVFSRARDALGHDGFRIHDFRHTAATHAIAAGADVKVVQTMLGHARATETLDRYGHLWGDNLDVVMDAMESARERALGNTI